MKVLSTQRARAIWLFPMQDLNPRGRYLYPVLQELVKRYKFAKLPNIPEALKTNQGLQFGQGAFRYADIGEINVELAIYNDGLVADSTTDTTASEALLNDLITWVVSEYQLKSPRMIKKAYLSEIFVENSKSLDSLNRVLKEIGEMLSDKAKADGLGDHLSYGLGGITFMAEQAGPVTPPLFRFERVIGQPYSLNRYFSTAGTSTEAHLEILEKLDGLLT